MIGRNKNNNNVLNNIDNIENISSNDFYKFYMYVSRFLSILWISFSFAFTVKIVITFLSPNWIGDTNESSRRGYFGLYSFCTRNRLASIYNCSGFWTDFSSFPNNTSLFKAATFLQGFTCLVSLIISLLITLCIFIKFERVFHICAWLQCLCSKLYFYFNEFKSGFFLFKVVAS